MGKGLTQIVLDRLPNVREVAGVLDASDPEGGANPNEWANPEAFWFEQAEAVLKLIRERIEGEA